MRPDWTIPRYNDPRINLSNNLCYDVVLNKQVDNLFKTKNINFRQYPEESMAYENLSKYHNINPKNICIGYGIGELITRILRLQNIKKISIPSPTWPMVEIFSKIQDKNYVPYTEYNCDTIYIANPCGVTGKCLTAEEILDLTLHFKLVIVDEAYGEFSKKNYSVLKYADKLNNLIVLKTFSKSLSLAGLRFGYGISNLSIIENLQLNRPSCVMSGLIINLINDLLTLIPDHVYRMNLTKEYIESSYDCNESHGNYVLFNKKPDMIENHFLLKNTEHGYRMALLNLELFKKFGF